MMIYSRMVAGCWIVFAGYWIVSGLRAKRSTKSGAGQLLLRIAVVTLVLMFVRSRAPNVGGALHPTIRAPAVRMLGVALCMAGIAFAIWARRHIGRNWGMPMTMRASPELVASGPYSRIRHPIYTGMLIALAGNALALSLWWLVALGAAVVYFGYAARKEEVSLLATFPGEYAEYQRRTNMIIPGVL